MDDDLQPVLPDDPKGFLEIRHVLRELDRQAIDAAAGAGLSGEDLQRFIDRRVADRLEEHRELGTGDFVRLLAEAGVPVTRQDLQHRVRRGRIPAPDGSGTRLRWRASDFDATVALLASEGHIDDLGAACRWMGVDRAELLDAAHAAARERGVPWRQLVMQVEFGGPRRPGRVTFKPRRRDG